MTMLSCSRRSSGSTLLTTCSTLSSRLVTRVCSRHRWNSSSGRSWTCPRLPILNRIHRPQEGHPSNHRRGRIPTIMHVSSQHGWQVGQSHSMSPSGPRGWAAPQRLCIGLPSGTLLSRRSMACRCPASGNQTKGRRSGYGAGTAVNTSFSPGFWGTLSVKLGAPSTFRTSLCYSWIPARRQSAGTSSRSPAGGAAARWSSMSRA